MNYTTDMTKGGELGHILRFALPMLAGNLFQQMYNVVDSIIVGKYLGYRALAAVGATGSITYLFYSLCIGLAAGAGVLISHRFGAGRHDDVKHFIANSAYVIGAFGIIMSVTAALLAPFLLRLLNTPPEVFSDAVGYMRIACAGTIAVAAYNWIGTVMRSMGDSRTPLIFLLVASVINVVLDVLFVFVLKTGVNGAAWATIASQAFSAVACIVFAFRKNPMFRMNRKNAALDLNAAGLCVRTGVPIALQNALVSISMISLQRTANGFGDTVVAAYTATMRIEQLVQQPFSSLSTAMTSFTGQNMGSKKHDRVRRCYRQCTLLSVGFSLALLAVFWLFGKYIVSIFVSEKAVIDISRTALRVSACFYIFLGMIHLTRGLLNGAGDVRFALLNGIAEVVGRIGFAPILMHIPGVGYMAVWLTTCLTWVLTALMSVIRYFRKKWLKGIDAGKS